MKKAGRASSVRCRHEVCGVKDAVERLGGRVDSLAVV